ncbi:MAG: hypothetical protein ACRDE2_17525 [Chitinophagaceae bacterium]
MDERDVKIWILTALLLLALSILGFIIKTITHQILKRLDEIVDELKGITKITAVQEQQIKSLVDQQGNTNQRLNDHATRIRKLEIRGT